MALTGSATQDDVLLPRGWNGSDQDSSRLFTLDGLELHLISGRQFGPVAEAVGTLRESTYRQQLSGSGNSLDLDGRDAYYDHLLLLDVESGALAGSARLQFIPFGAPSSDLPKAEASYLEHVYPGIKALLAQRQHHVEIGRVALAQRFQRQPHSLMALFRGGLLISSLSGYSTLHGLVSYNHFAFSDSVNATFLSALMRPPYRRTNLALPVPRHPVPSIESSDQPYPIDNVQALELALRNDYDENSVCRCCYGSTSI